MNLDTLIPAAVQRVSFGMLPPDMQLIELQKHFSAHDENVNSMSQDSQEQARNYYLAHHAEDALNKRIYQATASIKYKSTSPTKTTTGISKIKMYAIPQNIKIEAQALIERISAVESLQIIFMKMWSLSSKAEEFIKNYFAQK